MDFDIIGAILDIETIAAGRGIRCHRRLVRMYGRGRWRKRKGFARIRFVNGSVEAAELHWYEATGIGRREIKIKRFLR